MDMRFDRLVESFMSRYDDDKHSEFEYEKEYGENDVGPLFNREPVSDVVIVYAVERDPGDRDTPGVGPSAKFLRAYDDEGPLELKGDMTDRDWDFVSSLEARAAEDAYTGE